MASHVMTLLFGFLFYKENGETMNRIHVMGLPLCPNTTKKKKQQRQYTSGGIPPSTILFI